MSDLLQSDLCHVVDITNSMVTHVTFLLVVKKVERAIHMSSWKYNGRIVLQMAIPSKSTKARTSMLFVDLSDAVHDS